MTSNYAANKESRLEILVSYGNESVSNLQNLFMNRWQPQIDAEKQARGLSQQGDQNAHSHIKSDFSKSIYYLISVVENSTARD